MSRLSSLLPVLLLLACGPAADPSGGDPARALFARSLGVDLAAMELRESGLYVQDVEVGTGVEATSGRTLSVHYTGWLADGTRFDTSEGRSPFRFTVGEGRVIDGWDEGTLGMREGGKRRLVIPSTLGYGERGVEGTIPPNAVLVFDVHLVTVQ